MSNQFITTRTQWLLLRPFAMRGIYLSGPISADPETAPERFQKARDFIAEVFGPDQPIASPIGITLDNPDVPPSIIDPARYSHPLYMIECYKFLQACNCIALLPGWHQSKGAVYEARFAESLGIAPMFLHRNIAGDELLLDLSETFKALLRAEWVDLAIAETEFGYVGGDPNPFDVMVDNATALAMADRAAMTSNMLRGLGNAGGCPFDHIAP